jgi:hypothetical protein
MSAPPPIRVRRANLVLAILGVTCVVVVAVGVVYGIATDPGEHAFIDELTLPQPPPPTPPPRDLLMEASRVSSKSESVADNLVADKEPLAQAADESVAMTRTFADVCRASLATADTRRFLSEHQRSDYLTIAWRYDERDLDDMRLALVELAWMLNLIGTRMTATADASNSSAAAEVAAARDYLATNCPWPGWSSPRSFVDAADARVALRACAPGWEGLPARHRESCYLERGKRREHQRIVEDRVSDVIDLFDRTCDKQRRCRDDARGREWALRLLHDKRDHVERIPDKELTELAFSIEGSAIDPSQTALALIPVDGYLFPLSLPTDDGESP